MTIKELIERLQGYPEDWEVQINYVDWALEPPNPREHRPGVVWL